MDSGRLEILAVAAANMHELNQCRYIPSPRRLIKAKYGSLQTRPLCKTSRRYDVPYLELYIC